jgi:hypothetical protein
MRVGVNRGADFVKGRSMVDSMVDYDFDGVRTKLTI